MISSRKVDFGLFLIWPIIAGLICLNRQLNLFLAEILFFVIPSVYLSWKASRYVKRTALFALIAGTPSVIVLDYIGYINQQWFYPHSILPYRFLGYVTLEEVLWGFLNFYLVTLFYEYFMKRSQIKSISNERLRYLLKFVLGMYAIFFILFYFYPRALTIPYYYLAMGLVLIVLPIIKLFKLNPDEWKKFLFVAGYFFYFTLVCELLALHLGWWSFPGFQFVGHVTILKSRFPVEEFVFWLMLLALGIIAAYEEESVS